MGDCDAIKQVKLGGKVENMQEIYCVIGDCGAYTATEHIIPI